MNEHPPNQQFPRDKDELLRDFYLHGRMKDIRDAIELRDRLAPKWWETIIGVAQFGAALGLVASILYHQKIKGDDASLLIVVWLTALVITLVFGLEFLIFKVYHLRRANDISIRLIKGMSDRIEQLEKQAAISGGERKAGPAQAKPSTEASSEDTP